ncbi:MAG: hypothetical protein AAB465_01055 [Patescibacteria group bacterium]
MTNFNISDHEFYPLEKENTPAKQKKELSEKDLREIRGKMKIEFALGWHNSAKDVEFIQQKFESCDVYIPETVFYGPRVKKDLDEISNGEMTPSEFMEKYKEGNINFPEFTFAILKMIYNSHKKIFLADIPGDTPELDQYLNIRKIQKVNFDKFLGGELEEGLKSINQEINIFSDLEKKRDEYIAKKIENDLPIIIGKNKKLQKKPEINVLISLGAVHTPAYIQLKKDNYDVDRSFPVKPFTFEPHLQGLRQKEFMPEKEISKDLLSRALMTEFLSTLFCFIEDQNLKDKLLSEINKRISIQEIENLSRKLKDNMARYEDKKDEKARKENLEIIFDLLETKSVFFGEGDEINDETIRELVEILELEDTHELEKIREKMKIKFVLGPHTSKENVAPLQKNFKKCDIYIPEFAFYSENFKNDLQKLSAGELTPEKFMKIWGSNSIYKDFEKEELKLLVGSNKEIFLADMPRGDKKIEKLEEKFQNYNQKVFDNFIKGNFDKAIELINEELNLFAYIQNKRDYHIINSLKEYLPKFINNRPNLKNKEVVNILISLGESHSLPYITLKKSGQNVEREYPQEKPIIFEPYRIALREKELISPERFNQDILAKSLIERFIRTRIDKETKDEELITRLILQISKRISSDEIKKLSVELKENLKGEKKMSDQVRTNNIFAVGKFLELKELIFDDDD